MYNKAPSYRAEQSDSKPAFLILLTRVLLLLKEKITSPPSLVLVMKLYLPSRRKCDAPVVQQTDNDDTVTVLFPQL